MVSICLSEIRIALECLEPRAQDHEGFENHVVSSWGLGGMPTGPRMATSTLPLPTYKHWFLFGDTCTTIVVAYCGIWRLSLTGSGTKLGSGNQGSVSAAQVGDGSRKEKMERALAHLWLVRWPQAFKACRPDGTPLGQIDRCR